MLFPSLSVMEHFSHKALDLKYLVLAEDPNLAYGIMDQETFFAASRAVAGNWPSL